MNATNPYRSPGCSPPASPLLHARDLPAWSWWNVSFETCCEVKCSPVVAFEKLTQHYQKSSRSVEMIHLSDRRMTVKRGSMIGTILGPDNWARHRLDIELTPVEKETVRIDWQICVNLLCGLLIADNRLMRECRHIAASLHNS